MYLTINPKLSLFINMSNIILMFIFVPACCQTTWLCDSFPENDPLSGCEWNHSGLHWGEENLASVPDPDGSGQYVLRLFYPERSGAYDPDNKGGTEFEAQAFSFSNEATLSYDVYFSSNFDFVIGGKLPGLYGGLSGSDWCRGGGKEDRCFSTRFHWRADGDGEIYGYIPHEKGDWFCDYPYVVCNFDYGHSFGRGTFRFVREQWQNFGQYIRLNDPGQPNGVIRIYYEGKEVFEIEGLVFREEGENYFNIDMLFFSTFFGGSTEDWASTDDVYSYMKNFRVTGQ